MTEGRRGLFLDGGGGTLCGDKLGLLRLVKGCCGSDLFDGGRNSSRGEFMG